MSVCTPCYNAGNYIDACLGTFTFGAVEADTEYFVWVQHNATGNIMMIEAESDGEGIITIEGLSLDPMQGYTIWVTLTAGQQTQEDITIDGDIYKCLSFSAALIV
jgi:hypothetical protein